MKICEEDYYVLDVETSGLDPKADRIIEIAAATVKDKVLCEPVYCQILKVNDGFKLDKIITDLTGIVDEDVAAGADSSEVLNIIRNVVGDGTVVCHNGIKFDMFFLNAELNRADLKLFSPSQFVDTAALFKAWRLGRLNELEQTSHLEFAKKILNVRAFGLRFNLQFCCKVLQIDNTDLGKVHRADVDVIMTYRVLEKMRAVFDGHEVSSYAKFVTEGRK